jgi:hypothetical protein
MCECRVQETEAAAQAAQLSPSQGFRHDPRRHSGSILASKIMASPAFGFSVGDFIAAAELITKIATALKDVGGAAHDYQALIGELELLTSCEGCAVE